MADRKAARELLESARVEWRRDWDALVIGFFLGVLATLVIGLTGWTLSGNTRVWTHEHARPADADQREPAR